MILDIGDGWVPEQWTEGGVIPYSCETMIKTDLAVALCGIHGVTL